MNDKAIQLKLDRIITFDGQGRPRKAKLLLEILEESDNIDLLKEELRKIMLLKC
jgi:hypothetical protein